MKSTLEGLQRLLSKPRSRKEPVTAEMLQRLVDSVSEPPALTEVRLVAICLLAYAGFLRMDEVQKLRCCNIKFFEEKMEITVTSSKTDQYRQGSVILIAKSKHATCPVSMLQKYFELGKLDPASESRLFRGITRSKNGESLRANGALSYTRIRELVLRKIHALGYDEKAFSLHSFRAGGGTTAATNTPGLPERHIKRHRRWRSERAKDSYIKDSERSRLMVSESLGM